MGIITVLTPDERVKWTQSLSKTEVDQVKEYCKTFPETRNLLDALVIPIRTNQNFANDLLLPTFYQAIKVEHTIGRFIAILISLFLDVITLPIRFITAIPRAATNAARKEHPLLELLRKKKVQDQLLHAERVKVKLEWTQKGGPYSGFTSWTDKKGIFHKKVHDDQFWEEKDINFIEVPFYNYETKSGSRSNLSVNEKSMNI